MRPSDLLLRDRRALLRLAPGALIAQLIAAPELLAQDDVSQIPGLAPPARRGPPRQMVPDQNAIVKDDYQQNLKDVRQLIGIARAFQRELEKDQQFIVSVDSLKRLDEIEKLTKRIRGRLKRA